MAGAGLGRLPLRKFVIRQDGESKPGKRKREDNKGSDEEEQTQDADEDDAVDLTPSIPTCLKQEYIFMPSRVRDAYLLTTIRTLIANGGRHGDAAEDRGGRKGSGWTLKSNPNDEEDEASKARSAIVFVSTCERAALVSTILSEVGVENVALHSLLTQNRRLAALGKFKSQHVRILVATSHQWIWFLMQNYRETQ